MPAALTLPTGLLPWLLEALQVLLLVAAGALWLVYQLWVHYVAIMRLKMVRDAGQLTPASRRMGYLALAIGYVMDFVVNAVLGTALFREWPRERTLSARLTRLSQGEGWRRDRAVALRTALLDNIDPNGVHR